MNIKQIAEANETAMNALSLALENNQKANAAFESIPCQDMSAQPLKNGVPDSD